MTELYPQPYQSDSLPQHHQENSFSMNKSQSRPSMSLILEDNDKLNSSLNYSNLISQKEQMQRLNRRLETYIEESHSIDKDIEKLMKENELLKSQLKPDKDYKVENFQDQYQDKFEALRREIRELSSECNRLEHDRQNTRTETELVNQKTKSLEIEREILKKSIKEAYEETQLVNDEHKKLALEIEVLKHEISEEEKRYETEQALLNSRLNANRNNLVEEAAMPNQFKTSSHIVNQIKEARQEIEAATDKYHQAELDNLNNQVKKYRESIAEKERKQKDLDKEIDHLENKKHLLEADVQALEAKIRALEISIDDMKLQHAGKISRLQEKMDKEQAQLENARKELDSIQKQLEMHLTDKQSLNDELDEMKRLLGINDNDDLSSVISEFSRERSVKAVLSRSSSTSSSRSASKNITAEKISLDASMKSNNPSLRIQREVNQAAENQAAPVNAPLGSSSSRASVNLKKANSRRTITFTRHENGGPTIVAKPDSVDMDPILINLKKLLKQTPKKADLKIAELLVQLTTKQRHKLERLYDDSNPKKPLRSLFDDKKRKSKPGFNKTIQLLLASDTERDALNIHQAMKKKNYQLIIEILVTRHSIHTRHIRQVYEKLFHKELKDQIEKTFTDQRLCILLLGLLFKERNANNVVDLMPVNKDLIYLRQLADEHTWTNIDNVRDTTDRIASRSFGHLWFLLKRGFNQDEYPAWLGKIKMEAEQRNEGIEFTEAITVFFNVIHDLPAVAFAKSLNSAIKNKEEDRVLHIIISRQEYDLKDIKLSYSTIYKNQQHLEDHLGIFETETYKSSDVLLRLIREYHQ